MYSFENHYSRLKKESDSMGVTQLFDLKRLVHLFFELTFALQRELANEDKCLKYISYFFYLLEYSIKLENKKLFNMLWQGVDLGELELFKHLDFQKYEQVLNCYDQFKDYALSFQHIPIDLKRSQNFLLLEQEKVKCKFIVGSESDSSPSTPDDIDLTTIFEDDETASSHAQRTTDDMTFKAKLAQIYPIYVSTAVPPIDVELSHSVIQGFIQGYWYLGPAVIRILNHNEHISEESFTRIFTNPARHYCHEFSSFMSIFFKRYGSDYPAFNHAPPLLRLWVQVNPVEITKEIPASLINPFKPLQTSHLLEEYEYVCACLHIIHRQNPSFKFRSRLRMEQAYSELNRELWSYVKGDEDFCAIFRDKIYAYLLCVDIAHDVISVINPTHVEMLRFMIGEQQLTEKIKTIQNRYEMEEHARLIFIRFFPRSLWFNQNPTLPLFVWLYAQEKYSWIFIFYKLNYTSVLTPSALSLKLAMLKDGSGCYIEPWELSFQSMTALFQECAETTLPQKTMEHVVRTFLRSQSDNLTQAKQFLLKFMAVSNPGHRSLIEEIQRYPQLFFQPILTPPPSPAESSSDSLLRKRPLSFTKQHRQITLSSEHTDLCGDIRSSQYEHNVLAQEPTNDYQTPHQLSYKKVRH